MQGSKQAIKGNHGANRQGANAGQTRNNQELSNNINKIDQTKEEQVCNICAQNVPGLERKKIFAFGKCDHHVCYVCSARLRVVCDQLDCPICRDKLDMVVFSDSTKKPFSKFNLSSFPSNDIYKIYFENDSIKEAYNKLLQFECLECLKSVKKKRTPKNALDELKKPNSPSHESVQKSPKGKQSKKGSKVDPTSTLQAGSTDSNEVHNNDKSSNATAGEDRVKLTVDNVSIFKDVSSLKHHLNIAHKLRLCDLCLVHDKLFPFEYSYYDQNSLKKHMKEGEPKTSHRGHPNCQLCHGIFFNMDELLVHMAREHFHCHICARQESNLRYYFLDYASLREHFKNKHFLCERGNCRIEQFTSAFENNVEFQLHQSQVHGSSATAMSRGESRQQRTITLDSAPHRSSRSSPPSGRSVRGRNQNVAVVSTGIVAAANDPQRQRLPESFMTQLRQQRLPSRNEFPALGQMTTSPDSNSSRVSNATQSGQTSNNQATLASAIVQRPYGLGTSSNSFVRTLGGGMRAPERLDESDFPPLPEQPKVKATKTKSQSKATQRTPMGEMSLDQLIRSSLIISPGNSRSVKKGQSAVKNVKRRPLKIELS